MVDLARQNWRDYEVDGVAASGKHKPNKAKIRQWGTWVESVITAFTSNGGLVYATRALLYADLLHGANTSAWVVSDSTGSYNGIYQKSGISGAGAWTRIADLPYSFISCTDAGAGTANAIIATSSIPTPSTAGAALFLCNIFEANSGAVTLALNGAAAKPVVTNSGNALSTGYLVAGMQVVFVDDGTNWRLVSDVASAAVLAGAEAAATAAEAAAAAAEVAAASASPVTTVSGGGQPGYRIGSLYGTIDDLASGSIMLDGRASFPNKLGVNNTRPTTEPAWGTRADDTSYVAGTAQVAGVFGYGNVNNALAGFIFSQHSMLYTGADHASVFGGSLHTIYDDTDYSIIAGGTSCRIQARGRYAGIYNSDQCLIETGASDAESGFRSSIIGSALSTAGGRNAVILGSVSSTVQSTYGSVFAGDTMTLTNGSHMGAGGSNVIMGAGAAATYSFVWGDDIQVDGSRSLVFGEGHRVAAGVDYNVTTGYRCKPPFIGARVHSSRQRSGTVGNNQSLDWTTSQETTDTTITRLPAAGSSTYPTQPDNSIVNGTIWVTGVSDAGVCSTFTIALTAERVGSGTATLRSNVTTTVYNGLALGTVPTVNVTTGGIYRVQVVGLVATNIRWDARFTGQQVVFA